MQIFFLAAGSALTVLFLVLLFAGRKYDFMIEPLDSDAFPLKTLYSFGFQFQQWGPARLRGRLASRLRDSTVLYYGQKYADYYAHAIWAQILSISVFSLALMFLLAGAFPRQYSLLFALIGVVFAAFTACYFFTYTENKLKSRRADCEGELPNAISKLALLVNSGVTLHEAWKMVAYGKSGLIYDFMKSSCESMDNGTAEIDAIYEFGVKSDSADIKKFTSALVQSLSRGGGELPMFLTNQASELWAQRRQRLLQKGEQAAGALLMPIALMFLGVMLIIIASAFQSFSI